MSVKFGFNYDNEALSLNSAISNVTIEDLDVIEHEVKVLEDLVASRSKQLQDHVSMLDTVRASITQMEAEEQELAVAEERKHAERVESLEVRATALSNNVIEIDTMVAIKENELSRSLAVQLEMKLDLDNDFRSWHNANIDYFNSQTEYTKANILQEDLAKVIAKQEASIILQQVLALDESTRALLDTVLGCSSPYVAKLDNWYDKLEALQEEALRYGLCSANQPGEIVKRLGQVKESLWKLEQSGIKEEIEALIFSMESETEVDKDKIRSFREQIKQLQEDAKEYNAYKELLYAWQVLDSIKPEELQEAEDERHARILAKKQEMLVAEEEHKTNSVMSHALREAQIAE